MGISTDSLILAVSCLRVALVLRRARTGGRIVAKSDIVVNNYKYFYLLYLKMDFDSVLITAYAIKADIGSGKTKEQLDNKYSEFKNAHPKVYNNVCTDKNSIKILEFMRDVTKRVCDGTITKERGDVEIGEYMAKLYLPTEDELNARL